MRFIDAEKLQELFLKRYDELLNLIEAGNKTIEIPSFIGTLINDTPTADVKPIVRGEWTSLTDCSNAGIYCSVCNKKVWKEDYALCNRKNKIRSNFCPCCGAEMKGV